MCGIGAISPAPGSGLDVKRLAASLMGVLARRGRDASGYAWRGPEGTWYAKSRAAGTRQAENMQADDSPLDTPIDAIILHTRFATIGHPANQENNHPVIRPGISLVHNGHTSDTGLLYARSGLRTMARVDTDAIAAMLEARSIPACQTAFATAHGTMALAWLDSRDTDPGSLHLMRVTGSPLCIGQTAAGDLIAASTEELLRSACGACDVRLTWVSEVEEGTYVGVRQGVIETYDHFRVPKRTYFRPDYRRPSNFPRAKRKPTPTTPTERYVENVREHLGLEYPAFPKWHEDRRARTSGHR